MIELKPFLRLCDTDPGKGVKLEYYVAEDDPDLDEKVRTFASLVYQDMPRETGWFHQSGLGPDGRYYNYQMFEFWAFDRDPALVLEHSRKIAETIGMTLEIDLRRHTV